MDGVHKVVGKRKRKESKSGGGEREKKVLLKSWKRTFSIVYIDYI